MMTDQQMRYMRARSEFKRSHIDQAQELLAAADAVFETAERKIKETQQAMDELRPIWAQGFSSDSVAAQTNGTALAQLWAELGVQNQTEAIEALHNLQVRAGDRA